MLLYALFLTLLGIAAASDLGCYRIPNWLNLALAALFVGFVLVTSGSLPLGGHLLAAGLMLAGGFILFLAGGMGAGDVKLMTVTALWLGLDLLAAHAVLTALAGLALLGVIAPLRLLAAWSGQDRSSGPRILRRGEPMPYGVAIAGSAAWLAAQAPPIVKATGL